MRQRERRGSELGQPQHGDGKRKQRRQYRYHVVQDVLRVRLRHRMEGGQRR